MLDIPVKTEDGSLVAKLTTHDIDILFMKQRLAHVEDILEALIEHTKLPKIPKGRVKLFVGGTRRSSKKRRTNTRRRRT